VENPLSGIGKKVVLGPGMAGRGADRGQMLFKGQANPNFRRAHVSLVASLISFAYSGEQQYSG